MTKNRQRRLDNAKRLAYSLEQSATPQIIAQLARLLNYNKAQLAVDVEDLAAVLRDVKADEVKEP